MCAEKWINSYMHAEGVPATSADIHSEKSYNNNSLLKFVVIGSQEHHWKSYICSVLIVCKILACMCITCTHVQLIKSLKKIVLLCWHNAWCFHLPIMLKIIPA